MSAETSATAAVSNATAAASNAKVGKTSRVQVNVVIGANGKPSYTAHVLSSNASGSAPSGSASGSAPSSNSASGSGKQEALPPTDTERGLGGAPVTGNQGNLLGQVANKGGRRKRTHRSRKHRSHKYTRTHRKQRKHKHSHKRSHRSKRTRR